jgi:phage tail sheath gpL-like
MTAISTAVSLDRVSAIVGYKIEAVLEGILAGNLPQRIAILAEANNANQSGLPSELSFTNASEIAAVAGYGSPAYLIARILRPYSGDKLGGIPTVWYPVEEAGGATATVITYSITGAATKNTTHLLRVSGRNGLDGAIYQIAVETGDGAAEISQKMIDAVNNCLGAPAVGTLSVNDAVFTTPFRGVSSAELSVEVDLQGDAAGLTYTQDSKVNGAGVPSISNALNEFGDNWNTFVINGIGSDSATLNALEAFNGNANSGTGRYTPTVFKPFLSLFADNSADTLAEVTALTDARKNEMTNVFCAGPNSEAFSFETAANTLFVYVKTAQDEPHTDPIGSILNDVPGVANSGDFADASKRDQIVKVGGSTIKLNSEQFEIVDLVTTSHPDDEPQTAVLYRWVRDWVINMNIRYKYLLLEEINVVGKTILPDGSQSTAPNTISPNRWKGILYGLADQLENEALIASADFMKESIQVQIGESNPNRFETAFKVEITGAARVLSTTNQFTFNFGG